MQAEIVYGKLRDGDRAQTLSLIREYIAWLNIDLCFQDIDRELAEFPGKYGEPGGAFIVARDGEAVIGCVGLRKMDAETCEMKRLFVTGGYKGRGVGKRLVELIIEEAGRMGYARMRLDTLLKMNAAVKLYRNSGFYEITPYIYNPEKDVLYLEKLL
jgi:GNAT superfamily N-acetyltransferase